MRQSPYLESNTADTTAQWSTYDQPQNGSLFLGCNVGCFSFQKEREPRAPPFQPLARRTQHDDDSRNELKPTTDLLAAGMSKLSIQEMSKALDDVHCVGEEVTEDIEMVRQLLVDFDDHVNVSRNPMYEIAAKQNRVFVEDEVFRLQFLRAQLYDAKKAVQQMMNFLKHKATYFGEDKLTKDITISDLNEDDLRLFRSGVFNIQQDKDRSGRLVLYVMNHLFAGCTADSMVRVFVLLTEERLRRLTKLLHCYHDVYRSELRISFGTTYW